MGEALRPQLVSNLDPTYHTPPKTKHTCEPGALAQVQDGESHALEHLDVAWGSGGGGNEGVMRNEEGSWEGSSNGALRPQHFAQSYSAWWLTELAIFTSHTFELLAVVEIQRCDGAVLEGVNVAWKSRGGRCIWQW